MVRVLSKLLILLVIFMWSFTPLAAENDIVCRFDLKNQKQDRFLILYNHQHRRWKNSTVYWWYNPKNQYFNTNNSLRALKNAMKQWERVCAIRFVYKGLTSSDALNYHGNYLVIGWTNNSSVLRGASAVTRTWPYSSSRGYITGGAVISSYPAFYYDGLSLSDFQGIMTHEIGHVIGIAHSDVSYSIMYASPYHEPSYLLTLKQDDINAAKTLYPTRGTSNTTTTVTKNADYYIDKFYSKYSRYMGKKYGSIYNCYRYFRCQNFTTGRVVAVNKKSYNIYFYDLDGWYFFGNGEDDL